MKKGSIVQMTNPGDGYAGITGVYGIVLDFGSDFGSEYVKVRTLLIHNNHMIHGITDCFKYRFTEVP